MSDDARKSPKFPWDYDIPNDAFWNSVEYSVARNFLQCYNESDISKMRFDETLSKPEKLHDLHQYLNNTFKEKEEEIAPTPLHDADYQTWLKLKLAMSTTAYFLENYAEEEVLVREMYDKAVDHNKKMSALHSLSTIMEKTERYPEAEGMAREVLPWMQAHELLGRDSPQALSCMRVLASSIWKQKRYEEAGEWMDRYGRMVEGMGSGKFGKYRDSEMRAYLEAREDLKKWRGEHGEE